MPIPLDVSFERTFSGTAKRIYQLLTEMGTSGDAIWPFASQPFMRSAGPLTPGQTEEWHLGLHAVLESIDPEKSIVWRIDNDGVNGTHGFTIVQDGKKTTVTHRVLAELSDATLAAQLLEKMKGVKRPAAATTTSAAALPAATTPAAPVSATENTR